MDCDGDGVERPIGDVQEATSITTENGAAIFQFASESAYRELISRCDFTFDASRDNQPNCVNVGTRSAPSKVTT